MPNLSVFCRFKQEKSGLLRGARPTGAASTDYCFFSVLLPEPGLAAPGLAAPEPLLPAPAPELLLPEPDVLPELGMLLLGVDDVPPPAAAPPEPCCLK